MFRILLVNLNHTFFDAGEGSGGRFGEGEAFNAAAPMAAEKIGECRERKGLGLGWEAGGSQTRP